MVPSNKEKTYVTMEHEQFETYLVEPLKMLSK